MLEGEFTTRTIFLPFQETSADGGGVIQGRLQSALDTSIDGGGKDFI